MHLELQGWPVAVLGPHLPNADDIPSLEDHLLVHCGPIYECALCTQVPQQEGTPVPHHLQLVQLTR